MMLNLNKSKISLVLFLTLIMFASRGSHFLTEFSVPDASLIIFLTLGIFCPSFILFTLFLILGTLIDFGTVALDLTKASYLTDGYWGLIPAYLMPNLIYGMIVFTLYQLNLKNYFLKFIQRS